MSDRIPHFDSPEISGVKKALDIPFVRVKMNDRLDVKMMYPVLGMTCAEKECYVREPVYEMLVKASRHLPEGYKLRIWDAWRPLALQKELYNTYRQNIIDTFGLSSLDEDEQNKTVAKYISIPSENPLLPPAHTTGGSVDVTLTDKDGNEVDMGTEFDDFSEKAETDYFEKEEYDKSDAQKNRRILYNAMIRAGFTNLPSEWWHYDFGNAFWSFYSGKDAIFDGIFDREQMKFKD